MLTRSILSAALLAFVLISPVAARAADDDGIVRIKSAYSMPETIRRLKKDVADKGIMFFNEIDQSKLAADAGVTLRPSTLLVFGNPPLGTLFLTSNPAAGLDVLDRPDQTRAGHGDDGDCARRDRPRQSLRISCDA